MSWYTVLQILGRLLPALPTPGGGGAAGGGPGAVAGPGGDRLSSTVALLRDATAKQPGDYDMWEMLGELLAPRDPAGGAGEGRPRAGGRGAAWPAALGAHCTGCYTECYTHA